MSKNLTIFKKMPSLEAPAGLKGIIMLRIREEERRAAKRMVLLVVPIAVLSLSGILWALVSAATSLSETGFFQYVSLIFSDTGSIASMWYPFALTIIDSLPVFALTVLTGALFAFVSSIIVAAKNARSVFSFA